MTETDIQLHDEMPSNLGKRINWKYIANRLRDGKVVSLPTTARAQNSARALLLKHGIRITTRTDKNKGRLYIQAIGTTNGKADE